MIVSFKHKGLKRLYEDGEKRHLPADMVDIITTRLAALDQAKDIKALDIQGYRLHQLKGELREFWSITVRANWRIIFRFENGQALDVEFIDYH